MQYYKWPFGYFFSCFGIVKKLILSLMHLVCYAMSSNIRILVLLQLLSSDVSSRRNSDPSLVNTLNVSASFSFLQNTADNVVLF